MKTGSNFQDNSNLPEPFFDSSGKKVLQFISATEIQLDLEFIMTRDKRLIINMPYLKTENKLSGNEIDAIRLLNFVINKCIIQLYVQELKSKKAYTLEWNLDYAGSYWQWSLADFETILTSPIRNTYPD